MSCAYQVAITVLNVVLQNTTMPICCECLGTEKSINGGFIHCGSCGSSVHPKCLRLDPSASVRLQKVQETWQCEDCKPCIVCRKTGSEVRPISVFCVLYLVLTGSLRCRYCTFNCRTSINSQHTLKESPVDNQHRKTCFPHPPVYGILAETPTISYCSLRTFLKH